MQKKNEIVFDLEFIWFFLGFYGEFFLFLEGLSFDVNLTVLKCKKDNNMKSGKIFLNISNFKKV